MTLEFRPARPTEGGEVEALLRSAFTPYVRMLGRTDGPGPYHWLPAVIDNGDAFVAMEDGQLVGVVTTSRADSERAIDHIAIEPDRQGQGIGSWLLGKIEDAARLEGATALSLYTAEIMDDLIRLYRRHGFVETRRAPPASWQGPDPPRLLHQAALSAARLHSKSSLSRSAPSGMSRTDPSPPGSPATGSSR